MKRDYSQFKNISIENELPIFFVTNKEDKVEKYFEKLGIKTLEDLFTEYDKGTFNDNRKKLNKEIKGQTSLLLFHYAGIPFCGESILNNEIPMQNSENLNQWYKNKKIKCALNKIGITEWEQSMIYDYCVSYQEKYPLNNQSIKLIEMMEKIGDDETYLRELMANKTNVDELKAVRSLMFKISFFKTYMKEHSLYKNGEINSYELNSIADVTTMHELKQQLDILLRVKKRIENHMSFLATQMSNVENTLLVRKR